MMLQSADGVVAGAVAGAAVSSIISKKVYDCEKVWTVLLLKLLLELLLERTNEINFWNYLQVLL